MNNTLEQIDKEIFDTIKSETKRQADKLELIASENFVSKAVMEAQGSTLTNKYAEGYPGKRYYGGCEWVDVAENLARDRAKELFGAEYANVQPHSGSQANMAVYFSFLKPGDKVMGMNLAHGGHLTHGSPVNFSGQLYKFVAYGGRVFQVVGEGKTLLEARSKAYGAMAMVSILGDNLHYRTDIGWRDLERMNK